MKMEVTIATHNGSAAHRDHNIRGASTMKMLHINKDGIHEIWIDETPRHAYHRLFDDAQKKYNDKQSRPERQIKNYYNKIRDDQKKHTVYEMIVGVYGGLDPELSKAILQDFANSWQERNPNLELIGAYYHADEQGEPHVHLDYIPVAHGYKTGMETQTGLVKAFGEMGFHKQGKATAQMQWEARENQALEEICMDYGLTVKHPERDKQQHLDTETYKATQDLVAAKEKTEQSKQELAQIEEAKVQAEEKLAKADAALMKQEDIRQRKEDKTLLGKPKGTVTMPLNEYESLIDLATRQKDVRNLQIDLAIEKRTLDEEKSKIKANLEESDRLLAEAKAERSQAPTNEQTIGRLALEKAELEASKDELMDRIEFLENQNTVLEADNKKLSERLKKSAFHEFVASKFEWLHDKFRELFKLEQMVKEPDSKEMKRDRYLASHWHDDDSWDERSKHPCTLDYTRPNHDGTYQYYWYDKSRQKETNSSLDGFLARRYLPLADALMEETGCDFESNEIYNQAVNAEMRREQAQMHQGRSR